MALSRWAEPSFLCVREREGEEVVVQIVISPIRKVRTIVNSQVGIGAAIWFSFRGSRCGEGVSAWECLLGRRRIL